MCVWVLCECIDRGPCADAFAFIHGEDCMCAFDCANWSAALKSQKSWEDRILWTAYKVCNEYLSLFIFARFRYFNVSSPLLLWVSATCGAILRHATQRGEGRGGGGRRGEGRGGGERRGEEGGGWVRLSLHNNVLYLWPTPRPFSRHEEKKHTSKQQRRKKKKKRN